MNEYTKEFTEKFWTVFGFKQTQHPTKHGQFWEYPDGCLRPELPSLSDLNALFRWAVPNSPFLRMDYNPITEEYFFETMRPDNPNLMVGQSKDPAKALVSTLSKAWGLEVQQ